MVSRLSKSNTSKHPDIKSWSQPLDTCMQNSCKTQLDAYNTDYNNINKQLQVRLCAMALCCRDPTENFTICKAWSNCWWNHTPFFCFTHDLDQYNLISYTHFIMSAIADNVSWHFIWAHSTNTLNVAAEPQNYSNRQRHPSRGSPHWPQTNGPCSVDIIYCLH